MYFRMALCYARSYDGFLIITHFFLCSSLGLAASVGHTLIMQVSINRFVVIECNARQWRPPVSRVGDVECVAFHPHDKNLINIVASMGGIEFDREERKASKSICGVIGFDMLRELRNQAADAERVEEEQPVRKQLFAVQVKRQKTKKSDSDKSEKPAMLDVMVGGETVVMQRPTKTSDVLVVRLTEEDLSRCFSYILSQEISKDAFFQRRAYGTSGQIGVWKYGKYYYNSKHSPELADSDKSRSVEENDEPGDADASEGNEENIVDVECLSEADD